MTSSQDQDNLFRDWTDEMPGLPSVKPPREGMVPCADCKEWVARDEAEECPICGSFYCKKHRFTVCPICHAEEAR